MSLDGGDHSSNGLKCFVKAKRKSIDVATCFSCSPTHFKGKGEMGRILDDAKEYRRSIDVSSHILFVDGSCLEYLMANDGWQSSIIDDGMN